ncbi:hypothetical protein BDW66DRAFT_157867 [Aspergillus desertorum]
MVSSFQTRYKISLSIHIPCMPSFKHKYRQRKRRTFHPPPLFWDKLSKLWLTKSALREVKRRNKPLSPSRSSFSKPHTFAPNFLRSCSATRLQEIRNCPAAYPAPSHFCQYSMNPTNSSSRRPTPTHTKPKTGSTAVYDLHFESHLTDHGIFLPSSTYPDGTEPLKPDNIAEIQKRIRAPRHSIALSEGSLEEKYAEITRINDNAADEQLVIKKILPILEGPQQSSFQDAGNHPFTNPASLTDGILANAKPIPTRRSNRHITPNFFVEAKGYDGSPSHNEHGGSSKGPNDYGNNAYTMASTFQAEYLGLYAIHPTRSRDKDRHTDFVMTQVGQWALDSEPETYQRGLNAYRNCRGLAKE